MNAYLKRLAHARSNREGRTADEAYAQMERMMNGANVDMREDVNITELWRNAVHATRALNRRHKRKVRRARKRAGLRRHHVPPMAWPTHCALRHMAMALACAARLDFEMSAYHETQALRWLDQSQRHTS